MKGKIDYFPCIGEGQKEMKDFKLFSLCTLDKFNHNLVYEDKEKYRGYNRYSEEGVTYFVYFHIVAINLGWNNSKEKSKRTKSTLLDTM